MSVTLNGTSGLTFNDATTQNTSAFYGGLGFRNRIINGAMMIDQRNAGASVTITSDGQYSLDRWLSRNSATSKISIQQNAGSVTPPTGFTNYLGVTSLSSYSTPAGELFALVQRIEGFNVADLGFGASGASTVTLSFWVRSSLTGTFAGSLSNSAANRSYVFTYTISAANTWEQKTVTIAGDTSGTWLKTNGNGLGLSFDLGSGSDWNTTAGSWQAAEDFRVAGAQSIVGTNGATFYITGVQLEKGSTATSFDYRPYGTELALCQRYFARFGSNGGSYRGVGCGVAEASTTISAVVKYPVAMRAAPTASGSGMATFDGSSIRAITAFSTQYPGTDAMNINLNVGGGGLTVNRVATLISDSSGSGYYDLSAEL